jgi:hypothetical protein
MIEIEKVDVVLSDHDSDSGTKIEKTVIYLFHPHHRDKTRDKSKWIIKKETELELFTALKPLQVSVDYAWNLLTDGTTPQVVGHSFDGNRKLKFAVFNGGSIGSNQWHGYPGDIKRRTQDSPDQWTREYWINTGIISPIDLLRLLKGKL